MIRIDFTQLEQINAQAEGAYPGESCGLLAGRVEPDGSVTVTRVVASPNVADPPGDDRFEVAPQVRFDLMRELDDTGPDSTGEAIVGHYHSHPDHPAKPSKTDLAMAFEPELVWLITAVVSGTAGRTRAWRLDRETGVIQDVAMEIGETA